MEKGDKKKYKKESWLKVFLDRPEVKSVLLGILTIIIGALCSFMGQPDFKSDNKIWLKIIPIIALLIMYVILLVYYSRKEVEDVQEYSIARSQNETYKDTLVGISSICKLTSRRVNNVIHEIVQEGVYATKSWNFDESCIQVCEKVYDLLRKIPSDGNDKYSVCYVRRDESDGIGNTIYVNAYKNKDLQAPTIYQKHRDIYASNEYYDARLFKENKSDIVIIIGKDAINQTFSFQDNESRKKHASKYNQYIGVPVVCDTSAGGKMVGLLEIVCLEDTEIAPTVEEIHGYITKYIVPYTALLLVMHKMEKALMAKPEDLDDEDVRVYERKKITK